MNTRDLFKAELKKKIAKVDSKYTLDLRAEKAPWGQQDREIFFIGELDKAFDYIENCSEWFVDIYENIWEGKHAHAEFTGVALLSDEFRDLLNPRQKSASEKFEARLKELGLWEEWCKQGKCGRVATTTDFGIIILCNEGANDNIYTESWFPPMDTMQKDDAFRLNALAEFCGHHDNLFVYDLCLWVARPNEHKCPLFPADVYFIWDKPEVIFFKDDEEPAPVAEYVFAKETEEYCEFCENDVTLSQELKVQKCPNCGKWIVPCSACPLEECQFPCPLERMASILNANN